MSFRAERIEAMICDRLTDYGYQYDSCKMYPRLYQAYLKVIGVIKMRLGIGKMRLDTAAVTDDELYDTIQRELDYILPAKKK